MSEEPLRLAYVEETQLAEMRECKLWFFCPEFSGILSVATREAQREHIVEANFYSRDEIQGKVAFPPVLFTDKFWQKMLLKVFLKRNILACGNENFSDYYVPIVIEPVCN